MTDHLAQSQSILIDIAGFVVALQADNSDVAQRIRQRYAEFLCRGEAITVRPHLTIALKSAPGALYIQPEPGPWIIESNYQDNYLRYRSYLEQGEVDLAAGQGWLELNPTAEIENFLRVVYAWLCLHHGGLLLHAAGVVRDGYGYVFFGPSGAGKTTTSRLAAQQATVLSDDLVILRRHPTLGDYWLHGVPFRGEMTGEPRVNEQAPLKGIFRLRQDNRHYLEPLPRAAAVAELVAASPFVVRDLALSQELMVVCHRLAQSVSLQQLHFRRDDGFWKVIDDHFRAISPAPSTNGR
ncbi:MAG: hypothetical protein AB1791_04910 [Chloroflexota bacterium]